LQALILLKVAGSDEEQVWTNISKIRGVDGILFLEDGGAMVRVSFPDVADLREILGSIRKLHYVQSTETRIVLDRREGRGAQG